MSNPDLTPREFEVLHAVDEFRSLHGAFPSAADLGSSLGISPKTAGVHLFNLRNKGAIVPVRHRALPKQAKFTYFFHDSVSGKVKIGCSDDIQRRKTEIETGFPCSLTLLALLPAAEWPERDVHERFLADRFRGEWFDYSDGIKEFVASFAKSIKQEARA